MKRLLIEKLFLILLLFLPFQIQADEIIEDFEEESVDIINEEFRKLRETDFFESDGTNIELKTAKPLDMQSEDVVGIEDIELETTIVFEGATADAYETTITATDPTADRTVTLPNADSVTLPSGAVFFMITGSCPAGTTDVTATYSTRFLKVHATQATLGDVVLTGTTDSHTLTTTEMPSHKHAIDAHTGGSATIAATFSYFLSDSSGDELAVTAPAGMKTTGSDGGHTHDLSGATTLEPKSVTAKLCQVD